MPIALRARDVMDTRVIVVDQEEPMAEVLRKMLGAGVWSVVVASSGKPASVLTERDFVRKCLASGRGDPLALKAGEVASSPLVTCGPDDPVGHVWRLMVEKGIRRVYVVEGDRIVGRITQTGLFEKVLEAFLAISQALSAV